MYIPRIVIKNPVTINKSRKFGNLSRINPIFLIIFNFSPPKA